jgi:N-acetyl-gamma-glutamylphosphate reductase
MASGKKVRVGVVGLGFGAEFVPLYQKHPDAECVAVCQRDEAKMKKVADAFKVAKRFTRYQDMLQDKDVDAIHVVTPIAAHASRVPLRPGEGREGRAREAPVPARLAPAEHEPPGLA